MPFQELDNKLKELQSEVEKFKTAAEHIDETKKAAQEATEVAKLLTQEFRKHLTDITGEVEKILKPHKELIESTEKLSNDIKSVDFPQRLDQQEKELRKVKMIVIIVGVISIIGLVLIFMLK